LSKSSSQLGKIESGEFLSFDDQEFSNDGMNSLAAATVSGSTKPVASGAQKENARCQKIIIEKYGEDEALGEFSTQAMALFSNLNYPNLKNELKGKMIFKGFFFNEESFLNYFFLIYLF
jgi:hypothetical protein